MDRILIQDLMVRGIIGINPNERTNSQDILVNIEMLVDTRAAAASDDIADAVNYRTITKQVITHIESSRNHLVEKLVADLAHMILEDFPVDEVTVRIEKPGALRFARSVGVEISRRREAIETELDA